MSREVIPLEDPITPEGQRLGAVLRALRVQAGLSGVDLAKRAQSLGWENFHNAQISKLETGRIQKLSMYDALAIGEALGLSPNQVADLFYDVKIPETAGLSADKKRTLWGLQRLFETAPEDKANFVQVTVDQMVAQFRQ